MLLKLSGFSFAVVLGGGAWNLVFLRLQNRFVAGFSMTAFLELKKAASEGAAVIRQCRLAC
jgi:hypothetical protein